MSGPGTGELGTIPASVGSRNGSGSVCPATRDHPRGCGEQPLMVVDGDAVLGPSPRVRGAVPSMNTAEGYRRTIPAGAGSRRSTSPARGDSGDHPRGCGEQSQASATICAQVGPSPRVRGAAARRTPAAERPGTIPAGAGSSRCCWSRTGIRGDHPRGCGEQGASDLVHESGQGPSPRVRGAVDSVGQSIGPVGTIPAGAGSSDGLVAGAAVARDHPRGCGEQASSGTCPKVGSGPSPRVRGAARRTGPRPVAAGTIPAGAGSRPARWARRRTPRDHPRGCGEQARRRSGGQGNAGPSPRVRGAVKSRTEDAALAGTIPAGAGSSSAVHPPPAPRGDHPRGCGEQRTVRTATALPPGPSPRVRGAGILRRRRRPRGGTIPAGAGSSFAVLLHNLYRKDHPRGCGEQPRIRCSSRPRWGPSPRVRGAAPARTYPYRGRGTIPAGAGSSAGLRRGPAEPEDHPRGCGEQTP